MRGAVNFDRPSGVAIVGARRQRRRHHDARGFGARERWGAAAWVAPRFLWLAGTSQAAAGPLDEYYNQTVAWAECPGGWVNPSTGIECATVIVPMDYKNPGNGN